jgi:hypothetical protein
MCAGPVGQRLPRTRLLLALAASALAACGGGNTSSVSAPDFAITDSGTVSVAQGATSSPIALAVTGLNGFTGNVSFTISGLPVGASTSPAFPLTLSAGSQQSFLVTVPANTPPGSSAITVTGSSGSLSHTAPAITLTTTAAASVSITPATVNVAAGGNVQFIATVSGNSNAGVIWRVNGIAGGDGSAGTITIDGLYTAPLAASSAAVSAASLADPADSATATATVLAPHRIGVRQTAGNAEFYDVRVGTPFVPRGNNYIRLANLTDPGGNTVLSHSTFNLGMYDPVRTETALAAMQASGYNVVTVTLNGCCAGTIGDSAGGLSKAYIANVADFLSRARSHGIVAVLASQWLPAFGGFSQIMAPCYPQFDDINLQNLSSCGIEATRTYYRDLVQGLIDAGAPLDAIDSYELWDEYYYNAGKAPLSATSGTVTTANGRTYDMATPTARQQMMDDGLVYFADQVGAAIRALDPTALVTISFFSPEGPNPTRQGDPRIIAVYPAVTRSTLDYVDLHLYPVVSGLTMAQSVQNFGMTGYLQKQPVQLGEFGAFVSAYATAAIGAAALRDWQVQSCPYGFTGWLLWTWDTDEQPELWNALSQGGAINQALAPVQRPNPCS